MKLCTLNIWGGKLSDQLLDFIKDYSSQIDIFCFQEVYRSPENRIIARGMNANIYGDISNVLVNHQGYFAKHLVGRDLDQKVNFPLEQGLALFVKKGIQINECNDLFIYREGFELINDDIKTIPRNLQYISFTVKEKKYLLCHFHGLWYPKSKIDTDERIKQSHIIRDFLSGRTEAKILCGDFNLLPTTNSIKLLEEGMKNLIVEYQIPTTRNHYYEREEKLADYVLVSSEITVEQFYVLDKEVSDHLPVILEFS
jgi:exonuclease III